MDGLGTKSIDGGKLSENLSFERLLQGDGELPFDLAARLYLQLGRLVQHPVYENFSEVVRLPLSDAVALLWKVKEIEQVELGYAACGMFRESVEQAGLPIRKQSQMRQRLSEQYGVELDSQQVGQLREVALGIVTRLRSDLRSWGQVFPEIEGNDELMVEFLTQRRSLYWDVLLHLCLQTRQLLERLDTLLESLVFSLRMIGSPVNVNQRMVRNLTLSLWRAVQVITEMRKKQPFSAHQSERGGMERILDRAQIYPPYYQSLSVAVGRIGDLLEGEGDGNSHGQGKLFDMLPNFQELKKNYLERGYREVQYCWGAEPQQLMISPAQGSDDDPLITVENSFPPQTARDVAPDT
jgi:hypothetical protein